MITSAILTVLYYFFYGITAPIRALPAVSLNSSTTEAITNASSYIAIPASIFPVGTLLTIFGIILTVEATILVYKLIMWVKKLVW